MKPWMTISLMAVTAALSVAACGQAGAGQATASGAAQAAEADPAAMPPMDQFAPPPGPETPRPVQPLSNTATAVTGAATFGPAAYHFALGQTYGVKVEQTVAALHHASHGRLREPEVGAQVDVEDSIPVLVLHAHQEPALGEAGVGNQDIEAAEGVLGLTNQR